MGQFPCDHSNQPMGAEPWNVPRVVRKTDRKRLAGPRSCARGSPPASPPWDPALRDVASCFFLVSHVPGAASPHHPETSLRRRRGRFRSRAGRRVVIHRRATETVSGRNTPHVDAGHGCGTRGPHRLVRCSQNWMSSAIPGPVWDAIRAAISRCLACCKVMRESALRRSIIQFTPALPTWATVTP